MFKVIFLWEAKSSVKVITIIEIISNHFQKYFKTLMFLEGILSSEQSLFLSYVVNVPQANCQSTSVGY